jgi:hypothetical protein
MKTLPLDAKVAPANIRGSHRHVHVHVYTPDESIVHTVRSAIGASRLQACYRGLQLASNSRKNPNSRQVIIAHSHGGNVVARALGYLDFDVSVLRICYLATPFMQLFRRTVWTWSINLQPQRSGCFL